LSKVRESFIYLSNQNNKTMSTKFFFKETAWREIRVDLSEEQEKEVVKLIETGVIDNCEDLYNHFYGEDIFPYHNDYEFETPEPLSKKENDNQPTIEVYLSGGKKVEPDVTN